MWLLTRHGFFSIVEKTEDRARGTLTVRARVESDLDALRTHVLPTLGPTLVKPHADYRFRAVAGKAEIAAAIAKLTHDIDYSNFKNEVARRQGRKRENLYHDVWDVLHRLQEPASVT